MMCSGLGCLVAALSLAGTDGLRVLPAREDDSLQSAMVYRCLRDLAGEAVKRRKEAYEGVKTPEQARAWQKARREFFLRQLGPMPQRTPLEAKVVGTLVGDGYRVEKVIYQSQPGHHVTAVVYLPRAGKPPYPGVLIPCGHSYDGKAADGYQRIGMLLARSGIAALCFDPIGQGERYQVLNADGSPLPNPEPNRYSVKRLAEIPGGPQYNPVEEHNLVGIGSVLLGVNTARYRIWDGLRSWAAGATCSARRFPATSSAARYTGRCGPTTCRT